MSEMLANQYFMVRKYSLAKEEYENLFLKGKGDDNIIKKLIVCYVVSSELDKATALFYDLIKRNPQIIIDTKLNDEDCPCPEIIPNIQIGRIKFNSEDEKNLALGILSLYCDINESIKYFSIISAPYKSETINGVIKRLEEFNSENNSIN